MKFAKRAGGLVWHDDIMLVQGSKESAITGVGGKHRVTLLCLSSAVHGGRRVFERSIDLVSEVALEATN
ncbi:MAG TPA: hypothetical protein VFV66_22080 [Nonomuraea sp.]|nr:hypothetical protein [Nonomuraea sp.]